MIFGILMKTFGIHILMKNMKTHLFSIQAILCFFMIIKSLGESMKRGMRKSNKLKNLIQHKSIAIKMINTQKCRYSEEVHKIFDQ